MNPFDDLGIPRSSTVDQAKKTYRRLAMKYHPDRVQKGEEKKAEAEFKKIKAAWELIEKGWVEPKASTYAYTQNTGFGTKQKYYKPEAPKDAWQSRQKDTFDTKKNTYEDPRKAAPKASEFKKAPWEATPSIIKAHEVHGPAGSLVHYLAYVSINQAYEGFIVEIQYGVQRKQYRFPHGTPHGFAKDLDVEGGKITIHIHYTQSEFKFKSLQEARREQVIMNGITTEVVRTGELAISTSVNTSSRFRQKTVTIKDFTGANVTVNVPDFDYKTPVRVAGKGFVDWYPSKEGGGEKRGDLLVYFIPSDRVPMNSFS